MAYYDLYAPDRAGNADAILRILPAEEIAKQLKGKYGHSPTLVPQQSSASNKHTPSPFSPSVSEEQKQSLAQQKMALIEKMKRIQAETATLEKLHQQIQTDPAEKADLMTRLQQLKRATAQIKEDTAIFKSQFRGQAAMATDAPQICSHEHHTSRHIHHSPHHTTHQQAQHSMSMRAVQRST
jgi:flagellar biosynthesis/type III secretory pathway chaperone